MKLFITTLLTFFILIFSVNLNAISQTKNYQTVSQQTANRLKKVPSKNNILAMEEKVIFLINQERSKFQLGSLSTNQALYKQAKEHSSNMASGKVAFGHHGFEKRADTIMKLKQHNSFGENVAYCYLIEDPLLVSIQGWMESLGHRENILGKYNQTGVGIAYNADGYCYITQLFAWKI